MSVCHGPLLTTEFGRAPVGEVHAIVVLAVLDQLTGDLTDVVIDPAHIIHTGGFVLLQVGRLHLCQAGLSTENSHLLINHITEILGKSIVITADN